MGVNVKFENWHSDPPGGPNVESQLRLWNYSFSGVSYHQMTYLPLGLYTPCAPSISCMQQMFPGCGVEESPFRKFIVHPHEGVSSVQEVACMGVSCTLLGYTYPLQGCPRNYIPRGGALLN